ncbi:MAG: rhodanese-like domain-containing protein [Myxococcales bacterium]|nr:rhodanese-like domain-containing protein [Myxococcales bacterium]
MTANVKPSGLLGQILVLVLLGALFGFAANVAQDADFGPVVDGPKAATGEDLDSILATSTADGASAETKSLPMLEPQKVDFMTVMAKMFGQPRVTMIDARDPGTYENGHIQGAINLDGEELTQDPNFGGEVLNGIPKDQVLLVYCSGGDCDLSIRVARILLARGFSHVYVYEGGYSEWHQEGAPTSRGNNP